MPHSRARRRQAHSRRGMSSGSPARPNLAIHSFPPSVTNALGRAPPRELPCSNASCSASWDTRPPAAIAVEAASSSASDVSAATARTGAGLVRDWEKSSAPVPAPFASLSISSGFAATDGPRSCSMSRRPHASGPASANTPWIPPLRVVSKGPSRNSRLRGSSGQASGCASQSRLYSKRPRPSLHRSLPARACSPWRGAKT